MLKPAFERATVTAPEIDPVWLLAVAINDDRQRREEQRQRKQHCPALKVGP